MFSFKAFLLLHRFVIQMRLLFNRVKSFRQQGSPVVRLSMCIHICGCTDLEQHTEPWLLLRHQSCWPWPLNTAHPTTPNQFVDTLRICNYTVRTKSPKFLCQTVHLKKQHASASATNRSAGRAGAEVFRFIIGTYYVACIHTQEGLCKAYNKNILVSNQFSLQPLHLNCIDWK